MGDVNIENFLGAESLANGQSTAGAASGTLVAPRPARRSVTVRNTHTSESCYIGTGTVSAANGFLLKAGESISVDTVVAINGIRAGSVDVASTLLSLYFIVNLPPA